MKHFALHACECEDWQVHNHDDQLTEDQWTSCFFSRSKHLMKPFLAGE